MRYGKLLMLCAALLVPAAGARAERKFILGTQVDFVTGGSNQMGNSSLSFSQFQKSLAFYYGVYPSLDLKATGRHSQLDCSYSALGDRFNGDQKVTSVSHAANANFALQPGRRIRLKLNGSYSSAPDYAAYSVYKGLVLIPTGFQFLFEPALAQRNSQTIQGGGSLEFDLTSRSYLTFGLSSSYRSYAKNEVFLGRLSDQLRTEGSIGYSYKLSPHRNLSFRAIVAENTYKEFGNARTESATIAYSQQLSPAFAVSFEAGPSYVVSSKQSLNYLGYLVSANISHAVRTSRVSLYYSSRAGDSTGYGSISDTQSAGLSFALPLGKRLSANSSVSVLDSKGKMDNPYSYRGLSGALDLSYSLSERWFFSLGGSYRMNEGLISLNQEYKRIFVSMRYRAPELWRFAR